MFWAASIWNRYSLPERRAESPVQPSAGPRMAKSTPARCMSWAMARATLRFLSSKDPAQPTQYRYSASNSSPGPMTRTPSRSLAHSARSLWPMPHGLDEFSMPRKAWPSSDGKSLSIRVR